MERRGAGSACEPVDKQALETESYPLVSSYLVSQGRHGFRPNLLIPSSARDDEVDSLSEVADGTVIRSQTMAAGIRDADGSCSRPRNFASTDTATNPSYPTLMDVNLVAVSETKGVMPSTEAAAVSLVPDISCVDSCVTSVREVRNTSTVSTKTSGLFKSDERESAESWSLGRAGESAMQVETGVLDGI